MAQSLCSTLTVVLQQILSSLILLLLRTPVGVQEELGPSGGASGTAPHSLIEAGRDSSCCVIEAAGREAAGGVVGRRLLHISSDTDFNNQVSARPIISSEEEEGISAMVWDMDDRQLEENEDPRRLESRER